MKEELKLIYLEWENEVLNPFIKTHGDPYDYSSPYAIGISCKYSPDKKTIMIVGQEYYTDYTLKDNQPIEERQEWSSAYLDRQLFDIGKEKIKYSGSPFWNFFGDIGCNEYNFIWNNLNKLHAFQGIGENAKRVNLKPEEQTEFNKRYGADNKSLLEREIELLKPDLVVFVTGPNYSEPMCACFGLDAGSLDEYKPTMDNICTQIDKTLVNSGEVLWTYHPNKLNHSKKLKDCATIIKNRVLMI